MLLTMDLEIQRNLAHLGPYDMLQELKATYSNQAEQELLQAVREFHTSKQEEGQSVSSHVLKMNGYIDILERLGQAVSQNLAGGHGKGKGKMGHASNNAPFAPKPKTPPPPKKDNPAKDAICHQCGEAGHWRWNCLVYLAELMKKKKLSEGAITSAVEAIGTYHLELPSGLVIVLNNCHYAPSITRVSKNNLVYFMVVPRDGKCVSCMSGKMARKPFSHQVERAKDLLGLIHTDVCGPFKIVSRQGASYFITFTNDFSRYGYVYLLKHKHEVFETFKVFQKEVENQLGKTIKSLRSDRGGEYMSQEFLDHLKEHGIIAHHTSPYTTQNNRVSERRNQTLLDMVRSMMSQTTLPKYFWDYALKTAARILNMVPTKKVNKTPYEI
nr:retrotransposon protein, putative, Ty1-copia subclass [Tanacetum cinerariifolium]